jgi:hypothetical protein
MQPDVDIAARWMQASLAVADIGRRPLGAFLTYQVQATGRLDIRLRAFVIGDEDLDRLEVGLVLTEHLDLCRLWVLDAYELIRTLEGCVSHGLWAPAAPVIEGLRQVKGQLAEIRMPLTKFDPQGRSDRAVSGDVIAAAVIQPGAGAGWNIGEEGTRLVTRRALSDAVLEWLELAQADGHRDG